MKNNLILQIIIILLIGYVLAYYIYNRYKTNVVIGEVTPVYFLQEGVYTTDKIINDIKVPNLTVKENKKYYTYLGMTLDKETANKIKEIYSKENINIYIKEVNMNNDTFIAELSQYDTLLKTTSNYKEITNILDTILSTYEECINI
mgnify:FL=1